MPDCKNSLLRAPLQGRCLKTTWRSSFNGLCALSVKLNVLWHLVGTQSALGVICLLKRPKF